MIRYRKQTDGFSCGPLSLYNILKKYGQKADLHEISEAMYTDKDGTFSTDFELAVRAWLPGRVSRQAPQPWEGSSSYIISVTDYEGESHLVSLVSSTPKAVYVANWYTKNNKFTHSWIRWETILKYWDGYSLRILGEGDEQ